jgi:hypothetical protein
VSSFREQLGDERTRPHQPHREADVGQNAGFKGDEAEIAKAADELRTAISLHVGRLADQILGRPELGTPEWREEFEARDTPEGQPVRREWHLVKIQICREAKVDQTGDVINARRYGATWQAIGDACGTSRQAAFDRWAKSDAKGDAR